MDGKIFNNRILKSQGFGTALIIAIAILDLGSAYKLFSYQQILSVPAMSSLLLLMLMSFASLLFLNCVSSERSGKNPALLIVIFASAALLAYSIAYDWSVISQGFGTGLGNYIASAFFSAMFLAILGPIYRKKPSGYRLWILLIASALIMALIAFAFMSAFSVQATYRPTDETAYNYYAAFLFAHGQNPYSASMQPILERYGIAEVPTMNGSYEYYYGYPPLSFAMYVPMAAFGLSDAFAFKLLIVFLAALGAVVAYYASGFNRYSLLPLFVYLSFAYSINVSNQFAAVSVVLALAYLAMKEKRLALSGILLGIAMGLHQVSWFAAPFFFIYAFNAFGRHALYRQLLASLAVLFLISLPFLSSAAYLHDVFGLFGASNTFYGVSLADLTLGFFGVPNGALFFMALTAFLFSVAMYYFYNRTLLRFMALIPAFIFLLSWKDIINYSVPYMMLFIAIEYARGNAQLKDRIVGKKPLMVALAALAALLLAMLIYFHSQYLKNQQLSIQSILIDMQRPANSQNNTFLSMQIDVKNNLDYSRPMLLFALSTDPSGYNWTILRNQSIPADGSRTYILGYPIHIENGTRIGFIIISYDYMELTVLNMSDFLRNVNSSAHVVEYSWK